ncbi:MAG TPA: calcium-binding protein [Sphingomicrobium sp.]|nr:calcium-binding protein [Sphingomicrobium sp.]
MAIAPALAQTAPAAKAPHPHAAKTQTRADVQAHVGRMFARVDANRDGFITTAEIDAAQAQRATKRAERRAARDPAKRFDRIDANKDGAISRAEFAAAPQRAHRRAGKAGHGMAGRMLTAADANKDGRVSLAEAQQGALAHFDRADLNRDGTLTRDERRQAHKAQRAARHTS